MLSAQYNEPLRLPLRAVKPGDLLMLPFNNDVRRLVRDVSRIGADIFRIDFPEVGESYLGKGDLTVSVLRPVRVTVDG